MKNIWYNVVKLRKGGGLMNDYSEYVNINVDDDEMSADIFLVEPPSMDFYNVPDLLEFAKHVNILLIIICLIYILSYF